jgi:peptidoglycan/LPS O-acetylase OafA/YrhL
MNEFISQSTIEVSRPSWRREFHISEPRPRINLEIEYLRAVAVLLVVVGHADALFPRLPKLGFGAWTGVDLFFCISGYVISRSFEQFFDQHIGEGRWGAAARAFWVRRIFRLTPSAWLWLSISIACSWGFNSSGWFGTPEDNLKTAIFFLTFVTNFAVAHGSVHAGGFFWSLTLEDQFYFVFPFFLMLFRGHWRWKIFLALIFLQALPDRSFSASPLPSYLWVTRLDALMWGCLIHQFSRSRTYWKAEPRFCRYRLAAFLVNGALLYCLIELPKGTLGFLIGNKIESSVALASAGLVFLASFDRGYILPLASPLKAVLAWVGARSYGIYLIHIPLFNIIQEMWQRYSHFLGGNPDPRYFQALMIVVLLPILAELNFRFVESPLRRKGVRLAKQIMATRPATAMGLMAGIPELAPPERASGSSNAAP